MAALATMTFAHWADWVDDWADYWAIAFRSIAACYDRWSISRQSIGDTTPVLFEARAIIIIIAVDEIEGADLEKNRIIGAVVVAVVRGGGGPMDQPAAEWRTPPPSIAVATIMGNRSDHRRCYIMVAP
jgi:hypothetical protein